MYTYITSGKVWLWKSLENSGDFFSYFVAILFPSDFDFTECVLMLRVISNGYNSQTA